MSIRARKTQTRSVGEAFEQFLDVYKLQKKFDESYLIVFWERILGKTISSRTKQLYIKDGVLFIEITSPSLKQDLLLSKTRLIELLNEEVGKKLIHSIMFL